MLARLADLIASHRILVSRLLAIAFFALMAVTESALEGRIISSVLFLIGLTLVGAATRLRAAIRLFGCDTTQEFFLRRENSPASVWRIMTSVRTAA
jgi:hypothetical protein